MHRVAGKPAGPVNCASRWSNPHLPDKTVPTDALLDIESLVEELLID
ncbi:MAG: hypothetical protein ACR5LB_10825 [Wolbachia sp.]